MQYLPPSGFAHAGQTLAAWISALRNLVNGDVMTSSEEPPSDSRDNGGQSPVQKRPWKPTTEHPFPWKPTVIGLVISLIVFVFYRLLRRPRQ